MKRSFATLAALFLALPIAACNRGEEPAEETERESNVMVVADSIIERDLNGRFDIDPRLDAEEIQLTSHAVDGEVTVLGQVPTRYELGIVLEVARSTPGVRQVWLDSVRVMSDPQPEPEAEAPAE